MLCRVKATSPFVTSPQAIVALFSFDHAKVYANHSPAGQRRSGFSHGEFRHFTLPRAGGSDAGAAGEGYAPLSGRSNVRLSQGRVISKSATALPKGGG